jgi:hypothetical protein
MRDLEAYAQHGRNNPHHPDQMREHPYDFVSLPEAPKIVTAPGHDSYPPRLYSGVLTLIYRTVTPLHVGSGSFESSQACGLTVKKEDDQPVRGIVRRAGLPILPGSSWKGAVRARYEAITRSRLALAKDYHKLFPEKVPGPLRVDARRPHEVRIQDPRLHALQARTVKHRDRPEDNRRQLQSLSPPESLFGAMGYRGRVHPGDGLIEAPPPGVPLKIAPMESPAAHRLAQPGEAVNGRGVSIDIREVEGRKFYYDGEVVPARNATSHGEAHAFTHEVVDYVPMGSVITVEIHLEAVDLSELGALLISAGYGPGSGILRFGGFKPAGLGKVELCETRAHLRQGAATRSWKRPAPVVQDLDEALRVAKETLIDAEALQELHTVTTLKRP